MFKRLRTVLHTITGHRRPLTAQGEAVLQKLGHRNCVGGMCDEIGRLQFDFLVQQGLEPSHYLLDIGCGSFRGGVRFIHYLDAGNYLGIDKERKLIELGVEKELGNTLYQKKQPLLVVSDDFTFDSFSKKPHFARAILVHAFDGARYLSVSHPVEAICRTKAYTICHLPRGRFVSQSGSLA